MEKTAIMTDTNSGITPQEAKEWGIYLLPMMFYVEGKEYKECISLDWETFYGYLREGKDVSTVQPTPDELTGMWDEILQTYDKVIYIPMSKALSGTYESALGLSKAYDGRVLVVPSTRISVTQEMCACYARKMADEGRTAQEILDTLTENDLNASIYITVDRLDYLRKSGRVSSLTALAGNVLNVKPIIQIMGGKLEPIDQVRGWKKAKRTLVDLLGKDLAAFQERYDPKELHMYIAHSAIEEEAQEWSKELTERFPDIGEIKVVKLPMSVCCHTGPGTIGAGIGHDPF